MWVVHIVEIAGAHPEIRVVFWWRWASEVQTSPSVAHLHWLVAPLVLLPLHCHTSVVEVLTNSSVDLR